MAFTFDPLAYIRGAEQARAVSSLDRYLGHEIGAAFDRTVDPSLVHRITERDLVAVTMLGGPVPPATALWLLGPGGPDLTAQLVQVPRAEAALWDADVAAGVVRPLGALSRIVGGQPGMTRAKTSRLLAAKRPNLVPISDRRIRRALGAGPGDADGCAWRLVLADPEVRGEVAAVRAEVPAGAGLSLLRVMHIVIWMREGGWAGPRSDPFPPFGPVKADRRA